MLAVATPCPAWPDDASRIAAWAARIRDQDWREACVFFKHEDSGAAPRLALQLGRCLASPAPAA